MKTHTGSRVTTKISTRLTISGVVGQKVRGLKLQFSDRLQLHISDGRDAIWVFKISSLPVNPHKLGILKRNFVFFLKKIFLQKRKVSNKLKLRGELRQLPHARPRSTHALLTVRPMDLSRLDFGGGGIPPPSKNV